MPNNNRRDRLTAKLEKQQIDLCALQVRIKNLRRMAAYGPARRDDLNLNLPDDVPPAPAKKIVSF